MSSSTTYFQKDVAVKLSAYFYKKINDLQVSEPALYTSIAGEYAAILGSISDDYIDRDRCDLNSNWLSCLSEPITYYTKKDLTEIEEDENTVIYSSRIDLAITPTILTKRRSLATHRLPENQSLFYYLSQCHFIEEIFTELSSQSNANLELINFEGYVEPNINRPVHLFGIEIENQTNPKHLMGDFLNVISLSQYPIVLFPEDKFEGCLRMLMFSKTVYRLKGVAISGTLQRALVLKVNQFRDTMNRFLSSEGLDLIEVYEYS
ncbi:hypothetical protein [Paenibacillus sp. TC-CSREp1]|uniref:hypothetical protein n=1 Tax=Paenibacillus sp. TC-CSREp1 TaxID=3410089 RepID=UPI003D095883